MQELKLNFSIVRDDSRLKGNLHEGIHGWLFHRLKEESACFADQIHSMRVKPFSIDAFSHRGRVLSSGQTISVAICVIDPRYSQVIFDSLANSLEREYEIGRVRMRFAHLQTVRKQTYEELIEKAFSFESHHVRLNFLTPTSFRREGVQILYPSPELVLQSLHNRWKEFCPVNMADIDAEWEGLFVVSRYQLQTQPVSFDKYSIVGCIGNIQYVRNKHANYYLEKLAHALFQFGTYSGVGYKTTMGLGKIQVSYS